MAVVVVVGVMVRIHRRSAIEVVRRIATRRRRQDRIVAVIVEAVGVRAIVVTRARRHAVDNPGLGVWPIPAETDRFKVFEGGEAEKLIIQFVVRHHRVDPRWIRTVGWDGNCNPSDATWANLHVLLGIAVTVVWIEVDIEIATISVVPNILNIIVDGDRIGIVGQHGL